MGSMGIFSRDIGYISMELSFCRGWFGGWFQGVVLGKMHIYHISSLKLIVGSMGMVDLP